MTDSPIPVQFISADQVPIGVLGNVIRGPAGANFQPDATGPLADRGDFDTEEPPFAFLATDTGDVYFREAATAGVWSLPVPFGGGGGSSTLADLTDVDTTLKVNASVLYYKSSVSKFVADDVNTIITLTDGGNF